MRVKYGKAEHRNRKLQHRVTRTRVKGSKLLEFGPFQRSLWIRRVLVHPKRWPSARAQEGQYGRRKRGRFFIVGSARRLEPRACPANDDRAPAILDDDDDLHATQRALSLPLRAFNPGVKY